jgi:hypothetical protein
MNNLKQMWASIISWWASWTSRWRKPELPTTPAVPIPEPLVVVEVEPPEVPAVEPIEEFEVAAIEPSVTMSPIPIDLDWFEPAPLVVAPPQRSERDIMLDNFLAMMLARELRKSRSHFAKTGSCNPNVPSVDSRAAGAPADSRVSRPTNSRIPLV